METSTSSQSWLARNEFLVRRLHSLSGLIPVGAYMTIHLLTNSSILASPQKFQGLVYQIHSLGPILPLIEWGFIFLPLIFHAVVGVIIIKGGVPNTSSYRTTSNFRYMLQRASGMIAMIFIFAHVFHMHGWFHGDWWMENIARPFGGAQFAPYNAGSTGAQAMQMSMIIPVLYVIGVLSCVFHLANGLWTMGITWGLWTSPAAQQRANWLSIGFGVVLSLVSLGGIGGFATMDEQAIEDAIQVEQKMFDAKVLTGEVEADSHKRADHKHKQSSDGHDEEHASQGDEDVALPDNSTAPTTP